MENENENENERTESKELKQIKEKIKDKITKDKQRVQIREANMKKFKKYDMSNKN